MSKENIKNIFVADDHPIVLEGMVRFIEREKDLSICGKAEDASEVLEAISKFTPDLTVVDLSLKSGDGLELIKDIRLRFPKLPVLVVSMHEELIYAERSIRAGAKGYIMKSEATEEIIIAIRQILNGKTYISERMQSIMLERYITGLSPGTSPIDCLSDREIKVFELIGRGLETRKIAEVLKISVKTVESHRLHIKEKFKIKKSSELFKYAFQWLEDEI